jgi:hypothetical protein
MTILINSYVTGDKRNNIPYQYSSGRKKFTEESVEREFGMADHMQYHQKHTNLDTQKRIINSSFWAKTENRRI